MFCQPDDFHGFCRQDVVFFDLNREEEDDDEGDDDDEEEEAPLGAEMWSIAIAAPVSLALYPFAKEEEGRRKKEEANTFLTL